jgi:hypothetical protein
MLLVPNGTKYQVTEETLAKLSVGQYRYKTRVLNLLSRVLESRDGVWIGE